VADAVLVKPNQASTLTESLEVLRLARRAGYPTAVSAAAARRRT
jgi:enolase